MLETKRIHYLHCGARSLRLGVALSHSQLLKSLSDHCSDFYIGDLQPKTQFINTNSSYACKSAESDDPSDVQIRLGGENQPAASNDSVSPKMQSVGAHLPPDLLYWTLGLLQGSVQKAPVSAWTVIRDLADTVAYLALDHEGTAKVLEWCNKRWLVEKRVARWAVLYYTVEQLLKQRGGCSWYMNEILPFTWLKLRRVIGDPYLPFPGGSKDELCATVGALFRATGSWTDVVYLSLDAVVVRSELIRLTGRDFFEAIEQLDVAFVGECVYCTVVSYILGEPNVRVVSDVWAFSQGAFEDVLCVALQFGYTLAWDPQHAYFSAARNQSALRIHRTEASTPEGLLLFHAHPSAHRMFWYAGGATYPTSASSSVSAAYTALTTAPTYTTIFGHEGDDAVYLLHHVLRTRNFLVPNFLTLNLPFPEVTLGKCRALPFVTPYLRVVVYHMYHDELELGFDVRFEGVAHVRVELDKLIGSCELLYVRVPPILYSKLRTFCIGAYARVTILPLGTGTVIHRIVPRKCFAVNSLELLD